TRPDARSATKMCRRRLSLNRVMPSAASGLYKYRVMTIGSPVASAVSGPGTAEMNAMRLPSGDHATVFPVVGSGLLVPDVSARNRTPVPSGRATTSPALSPARPWYAIDCPSGDHSGPPDDSLSPPKRTVFPSASVITQSWPYGRPAPSLLSTT